MGILDSLFRKNKIENGNKESQIQADQNSLTKINLRKEKLNKICLEKNISQTSRVALVCDYSGSMASKYRNGSVQELVERIIPLALKFDDNGELEMWLFHHDYMRLKPVTIKNYKGYIEKQTKDKNMGGTSFCPILNDIKKKYVKEEPSNIPTYVVFITDGECDDEYEAKKIINELSRYNIFIQFIGISEGSYFLSQLDTMEGRYIDNVNYFYVKDLNTITDDELYDKLLTEYPSYLKEAKKKNLI